MRARHTSPNCESPRAQFIVASHNLKLSSCVFSRILGTNIYRSRKGTRTKPNSLRPYITDFFDIAGTGESGWKIEEIRIPKTSPICGKTLGDLALRQKANVSVAAIINPEGQLQLNPGGDSILSAEATLLAIGWDSDIKTLEKLVIGG